MTIALKSLQQLEQYWSNSGNREQEQANYKHQALTSYCHVIFNLAEFQYID
ncbi:MAG: hypothetical protein R3C11_01220 [Planctomycetaceae bacterium]